MSNPLDGLDPETSAFKILVYLTFKDRALRPMEISRGTGEKGSSVRARLAELRRVGLVENTGEGYVSKVTPYDVLMRLYRG